MAESILADDRRRAGTPSFKYHDKGIMAMIGHGAAVAEMGKHHHELHGSVAFAAWLGVHAWLLNTTRARIDAFINWAWDSFSKSRRPGHHRRPRRAAHRLGRRRPTIDDLDRPTRIHRNSSKGNFLMIENARTKVFWAMVVLTDRLRRPDRRPQHLVADRGRDRRRARRSSASGICTQTKHSLLRNYPIVGRMPASSSRTPAPSCTSTWWRTTPTVVRSTVTPVRLMYQRAKNVPDKKPFGTELDVYADGLHVHDALGGAASDAVRSRRAPPRHGGRTAVHAAVLAVGAQHLGDELRGARAAAVKAMNTGRQAGPTSPTTPVRAGCPSTTSSPAAT